jgi:hypothetical protein
MKSSSIWTRKSPILTSNLLLTSVPKTWYEIAARKNKTAVRQKNSKTKTCPVRNIKNRANKCSRKQQYVYSKNEFLRKIPSFLPSIHSSIHPSLLLLLSGGRPAGGHLVPVESAERLQEGAWNVHTN